MDARIVGSGNISHSRSLSQVISLSQPLMKSRRAGSNRFPLLQLRVITQAL